MGPMQTIWKPDGDGWASQRKHDGMRGGWGMTDVMAVCETSARRRVICTACRPLTSRAERLV